MTTKLTKAKLFPLTDGPPAGKGKPANVTVDPKAGIEVQFNPTSLRIQRQNNVDQGGTTARTQVRQSPSTQSATLTFDLEFDTAEGDGNGQPVDVRTLTLHVRRFVEPNSKDPKSPPPRVLFLWGTLNFAGIVTSLTEDIDYFSPAGMALRAKLSVTITEQNLAFEALAQDAGSLDAAEATKPGTATAQPGSNGTKDPIAAALAQAGESLQQLLARLDADPAAWRSAMNGLSSPLALPAGAQVQLAANASVSAGLGVTAGFAAGAGVSTGASLGVALGIDASVGAFAEASAAGAVAGASASAGASAGASASAGAFAGASAGAFAGASVSAGAFAGASATASAGFALSAGGGVEASFNHVVGVQANAAADAERAAFSASAGASAIADAGVSAGAPVSAGASASAFASVSASAGVSGNGFAIPRVDTRATSYGFGVPLNPRAEVRTTSGMVVATGVPASIGARAGLPVTDTVTARGVPPWQQL